MPAVIVFPLARIHRAAAQPDDDRQMLDAHRALVFAGAAGRTLENRFLEMCLPSSGRLAPRPVFVQVIAQPQDDLLRVESFAGVVCRAMLRAPSAFHAGVGLQASIRVTSLPVSKPKSSSPTSGGIRLNPPPAQKYGDGAQHQVQVLGVRDQRQKRQQRQRVQPPVHPAGDGRPVARARR